MAVCADFAVVVRARLLAVAADPVDGVLRAVDPADFPFALDVAMMVPLFIIDIWLPCIRVAVPH